MSNAELFGRAADFSRLLPGVPGEALVRDLADALEQAESRLRAVEKLAEELPGEPYTHTHPVAYIDGDPDCAACWVADIRQALEQVPGGDSE